MKIRTHLSYVSVILPAIAVFAADSLSAGEVSSLPGTPTQTFNTLGNLSGIGDGNSTTFDGADYAGDGLNNVDLLDATFALSVTFQNYSTSDRQTLWETGGGTIGTSLNYESGNVLVMRMSGNDGGGNGSGLLEITSAPIVPGTYDLIWTFDLDATATPVISLYIDGVLAGSDTIGTWTTDDWSGSGTAGFGQQSGNNMSGNGSNGNISSVSFSDGSIDLNRGLEFYGDTLFVPEPTSLALLGLGGLLIARRRRG